VVIIPLPITVLPVAISGEVRCKVRHWFAQNVEVAEYQPRNGADRAELHHTVSEGAVFINPSLLVVFGIVRESRKDLYKRKNIDLSTYVLLCNLLALSFPSRHHPWEFATQRDPTSGGCENCRHVQLLLWRTAAWQHLEDPHKQIVSPRISAGTTASTA
jgi:hypothetical protein